MKHVSYTDPIFDMQILFCWDATQPSLAKFTERRFGVALDDHTGDGYFCRITNGDGGEVGVIALTTEEFTGTPKQYSILAHECQHAAFRLLRSRGIRYNKGSEEIFCYVTDNLIESLATKALAYESRHK